MLKIQPKILPSIGGDRVFETKANALLLDNYGNTVAILTQGGTSFRMAAGKSIMLGSQTDENILEWMIDVSFDQTGVGAPVNLLQIIEIQLKPC